MSFCLRVGVGGEVLVETVFISCRLGWARGELLDTGLLGRVIITSENERKKCDVLCTQEFKAFQFVFMHITELFHVKMSSFVRKPTICICENKDADQLHGNREADQRLQFLFHTDSTLPVILKFKISNF